MGKSQKVTSVSHPNLYNFFNQLKVQTSSPNDLELWIVKGQTMNGTAVNSKKITLTDTLINIYSHKPYVVHYMLAHEIIHNKNGEFRSWRNAAIKFGAIISKHFLGVILLQEIRASIDGSHLAQLTLKEIQDTQVTLYLNNKNSRKQLSYKSSGYPSRAQRIKYAQRNSSFTSTVAYDILSDFERTLNIKLNKKCVLKLLKKVQKKKNDQLGLSPFTEMGFFAFYEESHSYGIWNRLKNILLKGLTILKVTYTIVT
jgi:hypothetical protein